MAVQRGCRSAWVHAGGKRHGAVGRGRFAAAFAADLFIVAKAKTGVVLHLSLLVKLQFMDASRDVVRRDVLQECTAVHCDELQAAPGAHDGTFSQ